MKKSILFIDDDTNLLESMKRSLRQYSDQWEMVFKSDSNDAVESLEKKTFDVVVADYKMPDINGIQLLTIVKEKYPETKRVLLTGQSESEVFESVKTLVHKYISKPSSSEDVIAALKELIDN